MAGHLAFVPLPSSFLSDGVSAKLVAQRGEKLVTEILGFAGAEAGLKGKRNHRRRDFLVDRRLNGPAAFAGVFDVAPNRPQVGLAVKRGRRQLEEPGAD